MLKKCQAFQTFCIYTMQREQRPNSKANSPTRESDPAAASDSSDAFGLILSSDNECSSDADAHALLVEFARGRQSSSSESCDDDKAAGGGSAASDQGCGLALRDPQRTGSTTDTLTQQAHRVRGKHGKLKKMSTKYRHQEESEREEALQVRPSPLFAIHPAVCCSAVTRNTLLSFWVQLEPLQPASIYFVVRLKEKQKNRRAPPQDKPAWTSFFGHRVYQLNSLSSSFCATAAWKHLG